MESSRDAHGYKGQYAEMKEPSSADYANSRTVGLVAFFRKNLRNQRNLRIAFLVS